jgi:hypothetical protein
MLQQPAQPLAADDLIGSRRVWVSPATANPNGRWVEQQARNVCMVFQEQEHAPNYLIRDGDAKFTKHFDEILRAEGLRVQRLPKQSPNLNGYVACCTSFVQLETSSGNRRRSESLRPWLLAGAA